MPEPVLSIDFDLENPRAVAYLGEHGADLVANINETTRGFIRSTVTQGVDEGWSYDRVAASITERYSQFAVGRPQLHIQSRAHGIAVTEAGMAYESGSQIVADDLKKAGLQMEKFWQTVEDERVSALCANNQAQGWIPKDEAFSSGHQEALGHPYCRCTTLYRRVPGSLAVLCMEGSRTHCAVIPPAEPGTDLTYFASKADQDAALAKIERNVKRHAREMGMTEEEASEKALQAVREAVEGKDIAVRRSVRGMNGILKQGRFQTQFETKRSGGLFDPSARSLAERRGLGIPRGINVRQRPVYGYIRNAGTGGGERQYGPFEIILKGVENRSTFTVGDSISTFTNSRAIGTPLLNPQLGSLDLHLRTILRGRMHKLDYMEVQVQGGVNLTDIGRVIFYRGGRVKEGTPNFLKIVAGLEEAGIDFEIRDR